MENSWSIFQLANEIKKKKKPVVLHTMEYYSAPRTNKPLIQRTNMNEYQMLCVK